MGAVCDLSSGPLDRPRARERREPRVVIRCGLQTRRLGMMPNLDSINHWQCGIGSWLGLGVGADVNAEICKLCGGADGRTSIDSRSLASPACLSRSQTFLPSDLDRPTGHA